VCHKFLSTLLKSIAHIIHLAFFLTSLFQGISMKTLITALISAFMFIGMPAFAGSHGGGKMDDKKMDIVDTAVKAGSFNTLAAALTAADLVATLKGKGPFTVFAPTDAAFAKIPKADLDALLKDKAKLTAVLTYHVVAGKVMAADVKAGKVKTVQGSEITVSTMGGVSVDNAKVIKTDIVASNGVIHVIDSVIIPK
jgi:uncharacterized surface protein with fasciclin (FAS1) repeats